MAENKLSTAAKDDRTTFLEDRIKFAQGEAKYQEIIGASTLILGSIATGFAIKFGLDKQAIGSAIAGGFSTLSFGAAAEAFHNARTARNLANTDYVVLGNFQNALEVQGRDLHPQSLFESPTV